MLEMTISNGRMAEPAGSSGAPAGLGWRRNPRAKQHYASAGIESRNAATVNSQGRKPLVRGAQRNLSQRTAAPLGLTFRIGRPNQGLTPLAIDFRPVGAHADAQSCEGRDCKRFEFDARAAVGGRASPAGPTWSERGSSALLYRGSRGRFQQKVFALLGVEHLWPQRRKRPFLGVEFSFASTKTPGRVFGQGPAWRGRSHIGKGGDFGRRITLDCSFISKEQAQ
jgi:hypothetical protein